MRVLPLTLAVMVLSLGASAQVTVFDRNITTGPPAFKTEKAFEPPAFTLKRTNITEASAQTPKDPAVNPVPKDDDNKFHWKPALIQSGMLLAIQHAFRMTEKKTCDELTGPFFRDWKESVQNLEGWNDGGRDFTNYVAHPFQGAVSSRIFINNSGKARRQEFGKESDYWEGRLKSMAWSAIWSTQFEIGPISESSLGNVGQKRHENGRSKQTYGDMVITPLAGTGVVILEDIVDKYVLDRWLEQKTSNRLIMKISRSLLTPSISFANLLRFRAPWRRDTRDN